MGRWMAKTRQQSEFLGMREMFEKMGGRRVWARGSVKQKTKCGKIKRQKYKDLSKVSVISKGQNSLVDGENWWHHDRIWSCRVSDIVSFLLIFTLGSPQFIF